jgi:hypothetical protein
MQERQRFLVDDNAIGSGRNRNAVSSTPSPYESQMHTFKDNEGREWNLTINVNSLRRVKGSALGIDLTEIDKGEPTLAARLYFDVILICDVLYVLLKSQADERKLNDEQFGEGLGPEGLKAGKEALAAELTDFFRLSGLTDLAAVMTSQKTFTQKVKILKSSRLENLDIDELLKRSESLANAMTREKLKSQFGEGSSSLLELLESNQGRTPSES